MTVSFSLHRPLLGTIALLWLTCATTAQNVLSPQQFKDMVDKGDVDLILDVRTPEEWNQGHIEQATFVNSLGRTLVDTPALLINSTLLDLGIFACMHCRVIGTYHTSCISENILRRFVLISSLTVVYLSHSLRFEYVQMIHLISNWFQQFMINPVDEPALPLICWKKKVALSEPTWWTGEAFRHGEKQVFLPWLALPRDHHVWTCPWMETVMLIVLAKSRFPPFLLRRHQPPQHQLSQHPQHLPRIQPPLPKHQQHQHPQHLHLLPRPHNPLHPQLNRQHNDL